MKRILFIDRDGTFIKESPPLTKLMISVNWNFIPGVFEFMGKIAREMEYELVMVTNQDGLGRPGISRKQILASAGFCDALSFQRRHSF